MEEKKSETDMEPPVKRFHTDHQTSQLASYKGTPHELKCINTIRALAADGQQAQAEQLRQAGVLLPQAVPGDLADLLRAHDCSPSRLPAGAANSASRRPAANAVMRPTARVSARALMVAPAR